MKKLFLILAVLALAVSFFVLGLDQYFTLEAIKSSQSQIATWKEHSPLLLYGGFFLVYVAVAALSLPGAAVMTLAAGAFFGLMWGVIIVSFASTIGATLAFFAARFILRDSVQARFGSKLKAINAGVEKEGAFYLFTLRLVPLVPFFVVNLVMGLTPIKGRTFYWVSQVGMLAGTVVYVNAGTQLAQIDSLKAILSPGLLISFVLLGIFPLIAKKIVAWFQARNIYKRWQKPKSFDQNLVVIGGGAAGLVSAYIAAAVKAKVTLIESHKMGGDCLNFGCVPSKALIKSAKVAHQMRHADRYGVESMQPSIAIKQVMRRIFDVICAIEPHDSVERYRDLGVNVVQGFGRIIDPWTVEVERNDGGTERITTRSIVIAAGAKPFVPSIPGLDSVGCLTSDTLWEAFAQRETFPERLVILGGGPIGCELTQSFARLGVHVTQVEMLDRLMVREDSEVSDYVESVFKEEGIAVLTGHKAVRVEKNEGGKRLIALHQGNEVIIPFDELICAVGRSARLAGFGLENLGIETQKTVVTNEYLETLYPNIYAAGDVAGPFQFTHTAAHQAWYAAVNALFGTFKKFKADYRVIPWATFVDPEVARVGLNEQEAKEQGIAYDITRYGIDDLDRAIADSTNAGFVKVLTPPGKDKILGVTIVGVHAGDLLAEFVLAMKQGLGLNKILGTIHVYPTLAEANKYAAGEWKRSNAPEKLLKWLERYHNWRLH